METEQIQQAEAVNNCDVVVWFREETQVKMHFIKKENKVKPHELGFKYDIMTYTQKDAEIDVFSAIIGDPKGYVERLGRAGYHGIMVKQKSSAKKDIKKAFETTLSSVGFGQKQIKAALKGI